VVAERRTNNKRSLSSCLVSFGGERTEKQLVAACETPVKSMRGNSVLWVLSSIRIFCVFHLFFFSSWEMESIIEVQRSLHEERERCLDLIVKEYLADKKNVSILGQF
jgi:hypothetical protein